MISAMDLIVNTLPDWANWIAQDKDGTVWAYRDSPVICDNEIGYWFSEHETLKISAFPMSKDCDWQETLTRINHD